MSPILTANNLEIFSRSPAQTRRVGMRLGEMLQPGDLVCLVGDLGAGKTTFVQGVASGWGSPDTVTSPTFVLVNAYRHPDGGSLYHLDAYRLENAMEAVDLDLDMMLDTGPLVVEWADRILAALPEEHLRVEMRWIADEQRGIVISPQGSRYLAMISTLRKGIYGV